ncbi:TPA: UMP kinase [Candidatus Uhrbacteria bacterium]|uniref:UMP kinase n=1 Tax=Candidatus Uhrbacteria bacterium GW2011_GWC2_53_7 TaxID=1618986 RepID=A0A0G2A1P1_9BACT|nr:MAG: Aspartate/glutamate/uridylate kinase [Parcubacteria group bacterium GW2011_GWA2_53_21]KKW34727.1 MAG: Aspartate/glutamate/uridylate kinase [Candidatus Uhrbacteria bacterium GW2011_GWC2_53_7]HBL39617.1 UMP kinase [Candidatus Uhrbacteria bacterium]
MSKKGNLYILSLGGSMIVPNGGINVRFLKQFTVMIHRRVKLGDRFIIVCGGGATARHYIEAGSKVTKITDEDLDWIGIHATRLNAHLLRTLLRDVAHPVVIKNPTRRPKWRKPVLVGAGWRPGRSTDHSATMLAKMLGANTVVNISNIDRLYDRDPNKHDDARPVLEMRWSEYRKMVGNVWSPGLNAPFDPIASRVAQSAGLEVILVGGKSVANIEKIFQGEKYKGSVIR